MSIIQSKSKDGAISVIVAGQVSQSARVRENNRGSKASFSVRFDKGQYMQCDTWSDRGDVFDLACRTEKGDNVMVMGRYSPYTNKDGENVNCMTVDFIAANAIMSMPLAGDAKAEIQKSDSADGFMEELDDDDGDLPF